MKKLSLKRELALLPPSEVQAKMLVLRNEVVILDRDVASLYGVETRAINQAVKRNPERFDGGYIFQLDDKEFADWKSQLVTSNLSGEELARIKMGVRRAPVAFTERGLYMLATVLNSSRAIRITRKIIDTYAKLRSMVSDIEELQAKKDGSPEQAHFLARVGRKLTDLIDENFSPDTVKTKIEVNLAFNPKLRKETS